MSLPLTSPIDDGGAAVERIEQPTNPRQHILAISVHWIASQYRHVCGI